MLLILFSVTGCDANIQDPPADGVLGAWYDDLGDPTYTDATLNIIKEKGVYYLERINGDGSSGKYKLNRVNNKFIKVDDKFGAYYIISNSNLKIYDSNGFIRDAKKITSKKNEKETITPTENKVEAFISDRERKIIYSLLDYDKDCLENNNLKSELFLCNAAHESILRSKESAIRASDIFNDYKQNEIAADLKYKEKYQNIVGIIAGVNKDIANNRIVNLKIKSFRHINAYIKSDISDERLAALKVESKVYLGCYGSGMVMGVPIFKDCSLIDDFL